MMPDYLLEIGTEELPAGFIPDAQSNLEQLMTEALRGANLGFEGIKTFSTPRRLAAVVTGISPKQETTHNKVKGPPANKAFDADGAPQAPAIKFAEKNGLTVDQLTRENQGGTEYIIANVTVHGKPAQEVLSEIVPKVIGQLSGERPMRWGSYDFKFTRPIRWIVSLLGNDVVPVELEGVPCGRESAGHRILSEGKVKISNAHKYADELKSAHVIVDPQERRKIIEKQVSEIAASKSGSPRQLKGALLEEVVNITEWPHAVAGQFSDEYLQLPDTLIETVMVHHQRYFPIEKRDVEKSQRVNKNDLQPWFITIANNDRKEAEAEIKKGNERVLRARLADGRFFYFDDQKTKLEDRKESLKQLTFQDGLGSYADKVERLIKLATFVSEQLKLEPRLAVCLEQTAKLGKLDLVSNLVRELPELQGYVGSWYAEQEGQPPDVVTAIASHYSPRSNEDSIPKDAVGVFASMIDKIDNLVCLFALGKKPSGSSDPYALRRQAQGLIDILLDGLTDYAIDLTAIIEQLLTWLEPTVGNRKGFNREKTIMDLMDFLRQRLRGKLLDQGASREILEAVLSAKDPLKNLPDVKVRVTALENLIGSDKGLDVVRIGFRMGKILKGESQTAVNESLLSIDAERKLWETFKTAVDTPWNKKQMCRIPVNAADYEQMLNLLKALIPDVDQFFVDVMVNDEDKAKAENRHALLSRIYWYFGTVADFPKLSSLLV